MYIIGVYDVHVKRVGKIKKIFDKYLFWQQNSVFEGELTPGQFKQLQREINDKVNKEEDFIIFYEIPNEKWLNKKVIGNLKNPFDFFIE